MSARASRQRGLTLLEVMMSMAVVLVGMLGLVRVLSVSTKGSMRASRMTQGYSKASEIIEVMNGLPKPVLQCLVSNATPTSWGTCETQCLQSIGKTGPLQTCMLTTATMHALNKQDADSTLQQYAIAYDANDATRSTWVTQSVDLHLYTVQVTIGWNDDGTAPAAPPYDHRVTIKSEIYRN